MTMHGMSKTKEYRAWVRMKGACEKEYAPDYPCFGAKGKTYDPNWNDFMTFYRDMGDMPKDGVWLRLINKDGIFEKYNVMWTRRGDSRRSNPRSKEDLATAVICLDRKHYEYIQRQINHRIIQTGVKHSFSSFAREALESYCPLPKTKDMFDKK